MKGAIIPEKAVRDDIHKNDHRSQRKAFRENLAWIDSFSERKINREAIIYL
jgi:hypothetical protein